MSRMVGSTFGVAVMGAIVTTVGKSKLDQSLPHVPAAQRNAIASALGSGAAPAATRSSPQILLAVSEGVSSSALGSGLVVGALRDAGRRDRGLDPDPEIWRPAACARASSPAGEEP